MARLWDSGFEFNDTNSNSEWTTVFGSPTVQGTTVRSGSYAAQITSLSSGTPKGFTEYFNSASGAVYYYTRTCIRINALPSADNTIIQELSAADGTTVLVSVKLTSAGKLKFYGPAGTQIGSDSSVLTLDQWYRIEIKTHYTSGIAEMKIDGNVVATSSSETFSNAVGYLSVGGNLASEAQTTGNWYFDDIAVNNASGSQGSYPGDGKVLLFQPNADSGSPTWTKGGSSPAATNYQGVNEKPFDDGTTFNYSLTLNQEDIFTYPACGLANDVTFNCVSMGGRFSGASSSANSAFSFESVQGASTFLSTAIAPADTTWRNNKQSGVQNHYYVFYKQLSGAAWTPATFDAMKVGYKLGTANTNAAQITSIWVQIDYTPGYYYSTTAIKTTLSILLNKTVAIKTTLFWPGNSTVGINTFLEAPPVAYKTIGIFSNLHYLEFFSTTAIYTRLDNGSRTYFYAESTGDSTTTSNAYQDKTTLTFLPDVSTSYLIIASAAINVNSTTVKAKFRVYNSTDSATLAEQPQALDVATNYVTPMCAYVYTSTATPTYHTFKIQYCNSDNATTVTIKNARIIAIKLGANDQSIAADTATTTTSGTFQTKATLTFTPGTSGDYLILAFAQIQNQSDLGDRYAVELLSGSTPYGKLFAGNKNAFASTDYYGWATQVRLTLAASAQNFYIKFRNEDNAGDTIRIKYARIIALRLSDFANNYYQEDRGRTTTDQTSYQDKSTLTQTIYSANYLVLAVQFIDVSAGSSDPLGQLIEGSTSILENFTTPYYYSDLNPLFVMYEKLFTAGSTTWKTQWKGDAASSTLGSSESAIALIQLDVNITSQSTMAVSTDLTIAAVSSTTAIKTILEADKKSTVSILTFLETTVKSKVAIITTLQSAKKYSTVAILTVLQITYTYSTTAVKTTLEKYKLYSTIAIKVVLEKSAQKSTTAILTILEKAIQKSTTAVKTTLQTYYKYSTVSIKTTLEKGVKSNFAILTTLEKAKTNSTTAIRTILESNKKYSTVAIYSLFQSAVLKSTVAVKTTLEVGKYKTVAIISTLETSVKSKIALLTILQSALTHSTTAILTDLESNAQYSTSAILTDFEATTVSNVAIQVTLEATRNLGYALKFADGKYVDLTNDSTLTGMSNLSIEAWVTGRSFVSFAGIVSRWLPNPANHGYILGYLQNGDATHLGNVLFFISQNAAGNTEGTDFDYIATTTNLDLNTKYHIVAVFSGGNYIKIYINGVEDNSKPVTIPFIYNNTTIHTQVGVYGSYYWDGVIDEVRIYDKVLSPTEITNHYIQQLGQSGEADLLAGYHFDDSPGSLETWYKPASAWNDAVINGTELQLTSEANGSAILRSNTPHLINNTTFVFEVTQHSTDGGFKLCSTYGNGAHWPQWDIYEEANYYNFHPIAGNAVCVYKKKNDSASTLATSPALTAPYWLRVKIVGGTVYFDYANNTGTRPATEAGWTNLYSEAWDLGTDLDTNYYFWFTAYNTPTTTALIVNNFTWETVNGNQIVLTSDYGPNSINATVYDAEYITGLIVGYPPVPILTTLEGLSLKNTALLTILQSVVKYNNTAILTSLEAKTNSNIAIRTFLEGKKYSNIAIYTRFESSKKYSTTAVLTTLMYTNVSTVGIFTQLIDYGLTAVIFTPPSGDTFVNNAQPTTNYDNDSNELLIDNGYYIFTLTRILIKFDLPAIPVQATIKSALLKLHAFSTNATPYALDIHKNNADFTANTVTWNTAPSFVAGVTNSQQIGRNNTWYSWDVKNDIGTAEIVAETVGWTLRKADETTINLAAKFHQSEYYNTNLRPYLEIVYSTLKYSTSAILTVLESNGSSTVGVLTRLETPSNVSITAIQTNLEGLSYSTNSILTDLEATVSSNVGILSTFEVSIISNTTAILTDLESYPFYSTVGINITLESTSLRQFGDQKQFLYGIPAGFGLISSIQYRGQGFIPGDAGYLIAIYVKFYEIAVSDIKVYIDTADSNSFPEHDEAQAIYTFTIPNASLTEEFNRYVLTQPLHLLAGQRYVIYFSPWDIATDLFVEDYRNIDASLGNPYANGACVIYQAGTWYQSDSGDLDLKFQTDMQAEATIGILTTFETIYLYSTASILTNLESPNQYSNTAILSNLEATINSVISILTNLETIKQNSTTAIYTELESKKKYSTTAINVDLEFVYRSTVSILTNLETAGYSTCAINTELEANILSNIGVLTILESLAFNSTVSILTDLETAPFYSTVSIFTVIEPYGVFNTVAILTELETSSVYSTLAVGTLLEAYQPITVVCAILTTLEVYRAVKTIAILTTLQTIALYNTVAVLTDLEVTKYSTVASTVQLEATIQDRVAVRTKLEYLISSTTAILTQLESLRQDSTVGVLTILEKYKISKTVGLLTILESLVQHNTVGILTVLEKYKLYQTVAIFTDLTASANSTVGIYTRLEKGAAYSTIAFFSIFEAVNHYKSVAIYTELSQPGFSTVAVYTDFIATINSCVAIYTRLEPLYQYSSIGILTIMRHWQLEDLRIGSTTNRQGTVEEGYTSEQLGTLKGGYTYDGCPWV